MTPRSLRVPGADGLRLHLLEWSREGVPFLMLHGFGNEAHLWDDTAPLLAPHYRVLALDLRGHGESDHDPEGRYDHGDMVRDLEAVCGALDIDRLVLMGHSLGGRVATLFAGRHPARMAGLVIVDSGPEVDLRGSMRIRLDAEQAPESFASEAEFALRLARAYPLAAQEVVARMARHLLRRDDDGRYRVRMDPRLRRTTGRRPDEELAWQEHRSRELWDALARISCPTLVIRGAASDVLPPEVADRMVEEALADGRLEVIPRASHSVVVDNPGAFREALARFALTEG